MTDFSIPIHVEEPAGFDRTGEAIRIGVPLPRALVHSPDEIIVTDSASVPVPHQARALAWWSDRSIKWLLVDAIVKIGRGARTTLCVRRNGGAEVATGEVAPRLSVTVGAGRIDVDTDRGRFEIQTGHPGPLAAVTVGSTPMLSPAGTRIGLMGRDKRVYEPRVERLTVEEQGSLTATILAEGWFADAAGSTPLSFISRLTFSAGSAALRLDLQVRNTRAAVHPGGAWDLGDAGSWLLDDLSLLVYPQGPAPLVRWHAEFPADSHEGTYERWALYQDSSGGEHWDSPNHVDASGSKLTVAFRGYRITGRSAGRDDVLVEGHRASPVMTVVSEDSWIAAGVDGFWQNFPKALRWDAGALSVGLFPGEASAGFELQGGEQKRHTVWLDFGSASDVPAVSERLHPVVVWVDPRWVEASEAILWCAAESSDHDDARYSSYIRQVVEGPRSFVARREIIDEFGWRNFGDLYADHEAVHHRGPQPFVSHYNNQYDFVYGAFLQFHRTGDVRWRRLLDDVARHLIDIDIYHTQDDKAAFNGGLFWHTDHYLPAATSTHRTYSGRNGRAGAYGGGPSNEHDYSSGLLHYYYLTGDPEAAAAVLELADWVLGMDDGARTLFGLVDSGPTGGASKTLEPSYHHPGRGAGNSINTLVDAYSLSRTRSYLAKAEELIQRCIHPGDDIAALALDDPEHRWSYLVFLQVLGKYLVKKEELGEQDYAFHYARESLLHYAFWMADHEVPYKDVLHKVELPTETWPAHDIRKCHVLHVAARYAPDAARTRLRQRAGFFFDRCLEDLLSFETSGLTRPLVILSVFGSVHAYFSRHAADVPGDVRHNHEFGRPAEFIPQRARLRSTLASRTKVMSLELRRLMRDALRSLSLRLWRSR